MDIKKLKILLTEKIKDENCIENADMREYTSFKAGGRARLLIKPQNMDELRYVLYMLGRSEDCGGCSCTNHSNCSGQNDSSNCSGHNDSSNCSERNDCNDCSGCNGSNDCGGGNDGEDLTEYMILGNGTDVLIRDGGYKGAIVKLGSDFDEIKVTGNVITAGAGALLSAVAREAQKNGLTGMEFASGIPGSIGGATFMNAGAYDGEMAQIISSVKTISKDGTKERMISPEEMDFGYRHSVIQGSREVVTEVTLTLKQGKAEEISEKMKDYARRRKEKQPLDLPSAGSFFKRPPGHFAGGLIEAAGLKGLSVGGAQISPLHAGFIVNIGNATSKDIEQLMRLVQNTIMEKNGVMLEPEVRIIGEE